MEISCYMCKKTLINQGGLYFSPPFRIDSGQPSTRKYHLCESCNIIMVRYMVKMKQEKEG